MDDKLGLMMAPEVEQDEYPAWYANKKLDSRIFCQEFLEENPMLCIGGQFFTVDGRVQDENSIRKMIYEKLRPWFPDGLPKKTAALLECRAEHVTPRMNIPVEFSVTLRKTAYTYRVMLIDPATFAPLCVAWVYSTVMEN